MDESDGYFRQDRVSGRNTGSTSEAAQPIARSDRDNSGEGEDEGETSSGESDDARYARYLNSRLDEVSDPEMWMGIHHFLRTRRTRTR